MRNLRTFELQMLISQNRTITPPPLIFQKQLNFHNVKLIKPQSYTRLQCFLRRENENNRFETWKDADPRVLLAIIGNWQSVGDVISKSNI